MAWDTIRELPENVTSNPLWNGGSMKQSFDCGQLNHTKLAFWLKNHQTMDDLTPNERALVDALQAFHDEFNSSWEF